MSKKFNCYQLIIMTVPVFILEDLDKGQELVSPQVLKELEGTEKGKI